MRSKKRNYQGVLSAFGCTLSDTGLKGFNGVYPDMVTDGSWSILKEALKGKTNIPNFIKDELLKEPNGNINAKFEDLINMGKLPEYAIEPVLSACGFACRPHDNKSIPLVRFNQVDGEGYALVNAHFASLMNEIFPDADWFGTSNIRPVIIKDKNVVVAIIMPYEARGGIAHFAPEPVQFHAPGQKPEKKEQPVTTTNTNMSPELARQAHTGYKPMKANRSGVSPRPAIGTCHHKRKVFVKAGSYACRDCKEQNV